MIKQAMLAASCAALLCSHNLLAQATEVEQVLSSGKLTGNFQLDAQSYTKDSIISAPEVPERILSNAFLNLNWQSGNFSAGLRYESYVNPILGFDPQWTGQGIMYRYARYEDSFVDVTVGSFYEQFGSGMVLRLYEERLLGIDNAVDGIRLKVKPTAGLRLTGILGKQRAFFDYGPGLVRALDADLALNDLVGSLEDSDLRISLGGSLVSRFQQDNERVLNLPQNVAAGSARIDVSYDNFRLQGEYAAKVNDPTSINANSFNPGNGLYLTASYTTTGMGITASMKRIDNMDFRSDRTAKGPVTLFLNYLPALTRQHTYRLPTLYPYATQPNGEFGAQIDGVFRFPRNSFIGGKYGATLQINASRIQALDTVHTEEFRYDAKFMPSSRVYYQDFNIEFTKKWTSEFKSTFSFINIAYDKDVIEQVRGFGVVDVNVAIADLSYQLSESNTLRMELQHMWAKQRDANAPNRDFGDWVMALAEYTIAPNWYINVFDEYNYGNEDPLKRVHYFSAGAAYVLDAYRLSLSYGRQRAGILCVGGVCRVVPASNGLTLSISGTF